MSGESEIIYRDFWDVPRIFVVRHHGRQYLFDCEFDEATEDFGTAYRVYILPDLPESEFNGSWEALTGKAESYLGEVPVGNVIFDPSRRRTIDTRIIDALEGNVSVSTLRESRT